MLGAPRGRLDAVLGPAGLDRRDLAWTRAGRRRQRVLVQRDRGGACFGLDVLASNTAAPIPPVFDPAGGRAFRVAVVMRPRPAGFDQHFSVDVGDDPTHLDRLMRAVEHDPLPWLDDHRARRRGR